MGINKKAVKKIAKFGNRFMFEYSIELMRDQIIAALRKFLSPIGTDDIAGMVNEMKSPH